MRDARNAGRKVTCATSLEAEHPRSGTPRLPDHSHQKSVLVLGTGMGAGSWASVCNKAPPLSPYTGGTSVGETVACTSDTGWIREGEEEREGEVEDKESRTSSTARTRATQQRATVQRRWCTIIVDSDRLRYGNHRRAPIHEHSDRDRRVPLDLHRKVIQGVNHSINPSHR